MRVQNTAPRTNLGAEEIRYNLHGNYNPDLLKEQLPESMANARRWLLWKSIPGQDPAKKPRKVPFYADGTPRRGNLDSPEDQSKFGTFDEALTGLQTGEYTGLGFALGPDGTGHYWQGIDLDQCHKHPEHQYVIDDLPGYAESSPSDYGFHSLGYGRSFETLGSNQSGIEAYSAGRYFTVTGEGSGRGVPVCLADFVENRLKPIHTKQNHTDTSRSAALETTTHVSKRVVKDLRSALLFMKSDDRDLWVTMGQCLAGLGDVGRGLWLEWSATSAKFDPLVDAKTWDSFKGDKAGYKGVFAKAQALGWSNPGYQVTITNDSETVEAGKISVFDNDGRKKSQATLLIEIGSQFILFHCPQKDAYSEIHDNGITKILPVRSKDFREYLGHAFFALTGKGANVTALSDALNTLEAIAKHTGLEHNVYLRLANLDNKIVIDLGCDRWRVVEIDKTGWRILDKSPVKFYRRRGMSALPVPKLNGRIGWLKPFINVGDNDFKLVVAWLLATLGGIKPYPILILQGEQGTGKSTLCKILRALTDPSSVPLRAPPKEIRDLLVSAANNYVVVLDNLSGLSPEISDCLCRLSTGGGIDIRVNLSYKQLREHSASYPHF